MPVTVAAVRALDRQAFLRSDPEMREAVVMFCGGSGVWEPLFCLAVNDYHWGPGNHWLSAKALHNLFVVPNAPFQVNIRDVDRNNLAYKQGLQLPDPPADLFDGMAEFAWRDQNSVGLVLQNYPNPRAPGQVAGYLQSLKVYKP
jgi:hypothetical protein